MTEKYRRLASSAGVHAVRLCFCTKQDDVVRWMVGRRTLMVVGGRRRWWWPTAAQRIMRRLRSKGHEVVFAEQIQTPGPPTQPTQPGLSVVPVMPYFKGKLHILDTYASWQPTARTTLVAEADHVISRNPSPTADSRVSGGALYVRQQLTPKTALGGRAEYLRDRGGLFTGATRSVRETTVTYDYRVSEGFLVRTEWRRDFADVPLFLTSKSGVLDTDQHTATIGATWWFGTKRGNW